MTKLIGNISNRLNALVGIGVEFTLLYEFRVGESIPDVSVMAEITVLRVPPERSELILRHAPDEELKLWQARFDAGDFCYAAFLDRHLVHHSWVRRTGIQPVPEAARNYPVAPSEFWIYHCWTVDWARGKRIYPGVLVQIIREHFNEGFTRACIYTPESNIASQHGITRAGFHLHHPLRALRFGSIRFKLAS